MLASIRVSSEVRKREHGLKVSDKLLCGSGFTPQVVCVSCVRCRVVSDRSLV